MLQPLGYSDYMLQAFPFLPLEQLHMLLKICSCVKTSSNRDFCFRYSSHIAGNFFVISPFYFGSAVFYLPMRLYGVEACSRRRWTK
ncbi:hypothetical protein BT96DRAFT_703866 [Gymnopus androsaceus JB14]|uniref:Uncharacterized protein n=1 Tax=Gymnopus androsaceus JB14 TaxID=1447944 RepID=A0A6A4HQG1_9AGAR|nr:hypothetical protein BT96DRAFT_703866 [Gymnopus androsaceus JB14]